MRLVEREVRAWAVEEMPYRDDAIHEVELEDTVLGLAALVRLHDAELRECVKGGPRFRKRVPARGGRERKVRSKA